MDDLYLTATTESGSELCVSQLTNRQIALSGESLSDCAGYFLFERIGTGDDACINILARLTSDEAIDRVRVMLKLS